MKLFVKPHTATLKQLESSGSLGPNFGEEIELEGFFEETRELVRDQDGDEVVSSSRFFTGDLVRPKTGSLLEFDGVEHDVISYDLHRSILNGEHAYTVVNLQ